MTLLMAARGRSRIVRYSSLFTCVAAIVLIASMSQGVGVSAQASRSPHPRYQPLR